MKFLKVGKVIITETENLMKKLYSMWCILEKIKFIKKSEAVIDSSIKK